MIRSGTYPPAVLSMSEHKTQVSPWQQIRKFLKINNSWANVLGIKNSILSEKALKDIIKVTKICELYESNDSVSDSALKSTSFPQNPH